MTVTATSQNKEHREPTETNLGKLSHKNREDNETSPKNQRLGIDFSCFQKGCDTRVWKDSNRLAILLFDSWTITYDSS